MIDRIPNQDRFSGLTIVRRSLITMAGTLGGKVALDNVLPGIAKAAPLMDINEPTPIPRADGRQELFAPLRYAGRVVHLLGINGMDVPIFGWRYPGATLISVLATGTDMGINAIGLPDGVTGNPDEIYPGSYPAGMPRLTEIMRQERLRHMDQLGIPVRGISVALVRDALTRTYIPKVDEDTNPGWGTLPLTQDEGSKDNVTASTGTGGGQGQVSTQATGDCDPPQFTTLPDRPPAIIDGKEYVVHRRDKNSGCERTVWSVEPGLRVGQNTRLLLRGTLPGGTPAWSFIVSGVSAAVHREGRVQQTEYKNGDVVVLDSTNEGWNGSVGAYEFWAGVVPGEWRDIVARQRQALQSIHVGRQVGIATHRD